MSCVVCRVLRRFVEESEIVEMTGVIAMGKSFLPAGLFPEGAIQSDPHLRPSVHAGQVPAGRPCAWSFVQISRRLFRSRVAYDRGR